MPRLVVELFVAIVLYAVHRWVYDPDARQLIRPNRQLQASAAAVQ
ncbi:MAG: hypothetical protein U0893_11455 [Chloroflexota bacterium]